MRRCVKRPADNAFSGVNRQVRELGPDLLDSPVSLTLDVLSSPFTQAFEVGTNAFLFRDPQPRSRLSRFGDQLLTLCAGLGDFLLYPLGRRRSIPSRPVGRLKTLLDPIGALIERLGNRTV